MESILKHWRPIVISLSLVVLVCYLIPNDYIKDFLRFDSNVWGSVSDWVMIGITTLTAIYLVRTFHEQKRTNDLTEHQMDSLSLPKFSVSKKAFKQDEVDGTLFIDITLENNPAFDVKSESLSQHIYIPSSEGSYNYSPGEGFFGAIQMPNGPLTIDFTPKQVVDIVFSDGKSNRYKQVINEQNGFYSITWPSKMS